MHGRYGKGDTHALTLRPGKSSAIWLLLVCGLSVVGGVWVGQEKGWVGYLCAALFALGIPVALVQLLPGSTYLRISEDGLSFANLFRVTTIPWNVIDQFFVVSAKQMGMTVHKMVGFNYVPTYDRSRTARCVSSAIAQCEGALPDTYGKKAEELVDMLNRCLAEFVPGDGA
jgi:hypothetical protein